MVLTLDQNTSKELQHVSQFDHKNAHQHFWVAQFERTLTWLLIIQAKGQRNIRTDDEDGGMGATIMY